MAKFKAVGVKYLETPRGVAYTGNITEDGETIGNFHQAGCGGCTDVDVNGDSWKGWVADKFGESFEPEGCAVEHLIDVSEGSSQYEAV